MIGEYLYDENLGDYIVRAGDQTIWDVIHTSAGNALVHRKQGKRFDCGVFTNKAKGSGEINVVRTGHGHTIDGMKYEALATRGWWCDE